MHVNEGDQKLTKWRKTWKKAWESQGKRFGVSARGLGDEKSEVSKERSTEMSYGSHEENI